MTKRDNEQAEVDKMIRDIMDQIPRSAEEPDFELVGENLRRQAERLRAGLTDREREVLDTLLKTGTTLPDEGK